MAGADPGSGDGGDGRAAVLVQASSDTASSAQSSAPSGETAGVTLSCGETEPTTHLAGGSTEHVASAGRTDPAEQVEWSQRTGPTEPIEVAGQVELGGGAGRDRQIGVLTGGAFEQPGRPSTPSNPNPSTTGSAGRPPRDRTPPHTTAGPDAARCHRGTGRRQMPPPPSGHCAAIKQSGEGGQGRPATAVIGPRR